MFFFLRALISERYVLLSTGRWGKLAYSQIHDDNRIKAQSAKAFKKGLLGFCQEHEDRNTCRTIVHLFQNAIMDLVLVS